MERVLSVERCDDIAALTAALLASDQVVGWVQGRSEFGPRALGNRSILADPRPAVNKARINEMVKKREGYRPFAPAVLEEHAQSFFDLPTSDTDLSFMTFVVNEREEQKAQLGAITHVDGTARIQTVSRENNPSFHELISEFHRLTQVPILLNTSFNNNAEPIVDSVQDAITCFLTTGINCLVVGNVLVNDKVDLLKAPERCLTLRVGLRPSQRLVRGTSDRHTGEHSFAIETASPLAERPVAISEVVYGILSLPGSGSVLDGATTLGMTSASERARLAEELLRLWQQRAVTLEPTDSRP